MLSILIPTYNYDVEPLVKELHQQANDCTIEFEIIVLDDASSVRSYDITSLTSLNKVRVEVSNKNIGRSAARNKLANLSSYENLLFVDAGTFPKSEQFINDYLTVLDDDVIIGGMTHKEVKPKKPFTLRWAYTKKREANTKNNTYTSANFLIKKTIIKRHPFDESIKTYGYEDLLFFKTIESDKITLKFINNPVIHDCDEDAQTFIKKTEEGLKNLKKLSKEHYQIFKGSKIIKVYKKLNFLALDGICGKIFKLIKPIILKNLNSSSPSIFLFDLYKLGYFCNLKQKN
ncbi:glycosyltransferase family 2 protein [Winogradskyella algicola]|uniref:glycosyltransferase family 2 protein n=1 Tax=Winogradskyella algicola TaxID=2575815 RepID=UPI00110A06F6|nr:glycosyltransferase family A protein [Winogradskyella algicola]